MLVATCAFDSGCFWRLRKSRLINYLSSRAFTSLCIQFCCEPPNLTLCLSPPAEPCGGRLDTPELIWFLELVLRCRREPEPSLRMRLLKNSVPDDYLNDEAIYYYCCGDGCSSVC
jgi:hypothetical protein